MAIDMVASHEVGFISLKAMYVSLNCAWLLTHTLWFCQPIKVMVTAPGGAGRTNFQWV